MTPEVFREIILKYLSPILGAKVEEEILTSTNREHLVASLVPSRIALKPEQDAEYRLVITRTPGFSPEELQIAKDFAEELLGMYSATAADYVDDLLVHLPTRAISRHLGNAPAVKQILQQYEKWASSTYEGGSITASIGLASDVQKHDVTISEIFHHDFSSVITNGYDTLLVVSPNGNIAGTGQLNAGENLANAPYRLGRIAEWAADGKLAFVLNRLGEQLIFRNKKLVFAKRRGKWMYYPHETYIRQIQPPQSRELRNAIYESCLDVSFARTGGCIGVVRSGSIDEVEKFISRADRIDLPPESVKSKTLRAMIGTNTFQNLDRRLRQELLAMDGATIVNHEGRLLAVGAIISVPSGSEGGGRRAAAIKVSELGLGIKISEDGEISAFKKGQFEFAA